MLVFTGIAVYLFNLGFSYLVGIDTTYTLATGVDLEHDPGRCLPVEAKKALQYMHDKLHRRIVVVNEDYIV